MKPIVREILRGQNEENDQVWALCLDDRFGAREYAVFQVVDGEHRGGSGTASQAEALEWYMNRLGVGSTPEMLRKRGFAVAVFNPGELGTMDRVRAEDVMVSTLNALLETENT